MLTELSQGKRSEMQERQRANIRSEKAGLVTIRFASAFGMGVIALLTGFYYQMRRSRWGIEKLELLQMAAVHEERMQQLREERAQLEAHVRSSLDQLLQAPRRS